MTKNQRSHQEPLSPKHTPLCDYVSPAKLNLWLKCAHAFRLRYLQGLQPPATPATFVRRRVDAALGLFYRLGHSDAPSNAYDIAESLERSWDEAVIDEGMRFDSPAEETLYRKEFLELVNVYVAGLPHNDPAPLAAMTLMEAPLVDPATSQELGIPLVAKVDLVLDSRPHSTLVDFSIVGPDEEFMEILHEIELSCYAYAHRQATGVCEQELQIRRLVRTQPPKVEVYRFPPRTKIHFRRLLAVVADYLDGLHSGRFVFRPGPDCQTCEYCTTHCQEGNA